MPAPGPDPVFDDTPIPLWDEDVSGLFRAFGALRAEGVTDLADYLADHPDFALTAAAAVRILRVNRAALELVGARDLSELQARLHEVLSPELQRGFAAATVRLFAGERRFEVDAIQRRLDDGRAVRVHVTFSLVDGTPGQERLLVGTQDISDRVAAVEQLASRVRRLEATQRLNDTIALADGPAELPDRIVAAILEIFGADRTFLVYPCDPEAETFSIRNQACSPDWPGAPPGVAFPMDEATADSFRSSLAAPRAHAIGPPPPPEFRHYAEVWGTRSMAIVVVRPRGDRPWLLALHHCVESRVWSEDDLALLDEFGARLADVLSSVSLWDEVRSHRERLDLALSGSGAGLWDWDVARGTVLFDARYAALLGYEPGELPGTRDALGELAHPADRPRVAQRLRRLISGESDRFELEYRMKRRDGRWMWVSARGRAVDHGPGGPPRRVAGTILDISDRKRAELALEEEKERAEVTLHSIGDAVITTDAGGRVHYLNPVAEVLTGWTEAEARGRAIGDVFRIVHETTREPAPDPVARVLAEGRVVGLANHTLLLSRSGREYAIRDSAAPIRDRQGNLAGVVLVFTDETEARLMAQRMTYQATHDALTGLVNRREFENRLQNAIRSAREQGVIHTLCYLDLDQFKLVNDTAGHSAGDELLRQIAGLLAHRVRSRDTLARLGGDEFSLLLEHCPVGKGEELARSLVNAVRGFQYAWGDRVFEVGVSVGVVAITADSGERSEILARADVACYAAKDMGRNRVHVYRHEDDELARRRGEMHRAADLNAALRDGRFRLVAQPIVPLAGPGAAAGRYELLLRMQEQDELLLPGRFIPAAERFDLMGSIDRWVIREALRTYRRVFAPLGAAISVNLSGRSLGDGDLLSFVRRELDQSEVPPDRLCFEITETAAVGNLAGAREFIQELRAAGCSFALDDFGSGLSSFAYLKTLPVDYLKIDGHFVRGVVEDPVDRAMVSAVHELAAKMGIRTIAEYVESAEILSVLRELGVDYGQGYGIGRPVELSALVAGPG